MRRRGTELRFHAEARAQGDDSAHAAVASAVAVEILGGALEVQIGAMPRGPDSELDALRYEPYGKERTSEVDANE